MSKILVTGGAGMIGSNLVRKLVLSRHKVQVVDNLWRGSLKNLSDHNGGYIIDINKDFFKRDLSVNGALGDLIDDNEYVIHLADIVAGIGFVFNNQSEIFRQNILINSNVIHSAKNKQIKGFINVGTACSFPASRQNTFNPKPLVEDELYPAEPESSYGWSKLMGIYETSLLEEEYGVPVANLVFHNVYGAPSDYTALKGQVIPSLIRKTIMYPEEDFIVWGSGKQGRAFIHVDDVVNALILTMDKGLGKGVIQIGPSVCTPIKEIAEIIVRISGKPITIKYDLSKPEGDKARSADYSKAETILGWQPKVELEDGLKKLYEWIYTDIFS